MFDGKMKALTFSYDDGVTQDLRLIEIFDRYHLKATFNINSMLLGQQNTIIRQECVISHNKNRAEKLREIYGNHEVAAHTLTHPNLTQLDCREVIRQVEEDRQNLARLAGYEIVGMAYPCGGVNNNDDVANIIKNNTGIQYARTITSCYGFDQQEQLYRFNPTVYHIEFQKMFELGEKFIKLREDKPQIFYIWGHSYELDIADGWTVIEEFCRLISNRDDIFYGTNKQVLLGLN